MTVEELLKPYDAKARPDYVPPPARPPTSAPPTSSPSSTPPPSSTQPATYRPSSFAKAFVALMNIEFSNVCEVGIEKSWFSGDTLKIDWTSRTNKLHAMRVLAEIGTSKERLYGDGIRYLKFPNDVGTYNVIDWKTGEKTSISDRARYYFN
jgi:hypothetical protein